jgi:Ni,Fe-hydrogenase III small subunit
MKSRSVYDTDSGYFQIVYQTFANVAAIIVHMLIVNPLVFDITNDRLLISNPVIAIATENEALNVGVLSDIRGKLMDSPVDGIVPVDASAIGMHPSLKDATVGFPELEQALVTFAILFKLIARHSCSKFNVCFFLSDNRIRHVIFLLPVSGLVIFDAIPAYLQY